jgi:hypothetical protein
MNLLLRTNLILGWLYVFIAMTDVYASTDLVPLAIPGKYSAHYLYSSEEEIKYASTDQYRVYLRKLSPSSPSRLMKKA